MSGLLDRLRRERRDREAGMTLIEMMISLAILSVVLAIFMALTASVQQGVAKTADRSVANAEARLALQQIDREVRSGNVFYDPNLETTPNMSLRIYTEANFPTRSGHRCIQWRIESNRLESRSWDPNNIGGTATTWRVIAEDVVNRTLSPTVPAFSLGVTPYGGRILLIRLAVQVGSGRDRVVELQSSVNGRNTRYGDTANPCSTTPA